MIKYLKRTEHGIRLADDEEVSKELDVILQKRDLADKHRVVSGGKGLEKSNNAQRIREEEARLKTRSYTPEDRLKHEARLESLKDEASKLAKEVIESAKDYQLTQAEARQLEESFKETYIPIKVVSLDEILKLKEAI